MARLMKIIDLSACRALSSLLRVMGLVVDGEGGSGSLETSGLLILAWKVEV